MVTSRERRRWGALLIVGGLVCVFFLCVGERLSIRNSPARNVDSLCAVEARENPPDTGSVPAGKGEYDPEVESSHSWIPFGIRCDYGTAVVFKDLGTPAFVLAAASSLAGLFALFVPHNPEAAKDRAARRHRDAAAKKSGTWPPGGQVMR